MTIHHCRRTGRLSSGLPLRAPLTPNQPAARRVRGGGRRSGQPTLTAGAASGGQSGPRAPRLLVQTARSTVVRRAPDDTGPGFLARARLSLATRRRYDTCIASFASATGSAPATWRSTDLPLVDSFLESHLEQMFIGDASKNDARYLVAAVAHRFNVTMRDATTLPRAKAALAGWGKLEPDKTSDPLQGVAALVIADRLRRDGSAVSLQAARGLLLQFDLYLRPGELIDLPLSACLSPSPAAGPAHARYGVVVAPSAQVAGDQQHHRASKTGVQDDTVLVDDASRPGISRVLDALIRDARRARSDRLMHQLNYRTYNLLLQKAARDCGVPYKVTAHLARHGGPSEDYLKRSRTLADIQARGRWRAQASVQRYQKSGWILSALKKLPPTLRARGLALSRTSLEFVL